MILHFIANATGLYQGQIIWFDNLLHFLTGIAFGLTWLWILRENTTEIYNSQDLILAVVFVLGLAVLWELAEFGFLKLLPTYAHSLSIFSPSINEAFADIASNVLGVIVLVAWMKFNSNSNDQRLNQ